MKVMGSDVASPIPFSTSIKQTIPVLRNAVRIDERCVGFQVDKRECDVLIEARFEKSLLKKRFLTSRFGPSSNDPFLLLRPQRSASNRLLCLFRSLAVIPNHAKLIGEFTVIGCYRPRFAAGAQILRGVKT
jgi:hypothetical protein